jgi:hypothetical protein
MVLLLIVIKHSKFSVFALHYPRGARTGRFARDTRIYRTSRAARQVRVLQLWCKFLHIANDIPPEAWIWSLSLIIVVFKYAVCMECLKHSKTSIKWIWIIWKLNLNKINLVSEGKFNSFHFYKMEDSVHDMWGCYSSDHERQDVMSFSLVDTYQCVGGTYCLHVRGRRISCVEEWCRYEASGTGLEIWMKLYKPSAFSRAVL